MTTVAMFNCRSNKHTHKLANGTEITFKKQWAKDNTLPSEAGDYYLTTDVTLTETWNVPGTVNLCLNGHSITLNWNDSVIVVGSGKTLNLYDNADDKGKITHGTNDNNKTYTGSGVKVENGTFTMYGGSITGNRGSDVGGVDVVGGTFNLHGGVVSDNVGENDRFAIGGVAVKTGKLDSGTIDSHGTFNMSGGSITNNTATSNGGGVYVYGTFKVSGNPVIEGNKTGTGEDETVQNVYLPSDKTITVDGALTTGANIGVTIATANGTGTFTTGYGANNKDGEGKVIAPGTYFFSDDSSLKVLRDVSETTTEAKLGTHAHDYIYAVENTATLTATCQNTDGGHEGTIEPIILTIKKPARTTYGGAESEKATLDGLDAFNTGTGLNVSENAILYYTATKDGSTYTKEGATALSAAPTDAGDYLAEIPVSNMSAAVGYTIAKAENTTAVSAPQAASIGYYSITLKATDGYEYMREGGNWQSSPTFTGLADGRAYTFYQRVAETANYQASDPSAGATIRTYIYIPPHYHTWTYVAEGSTITATCGNTDGRHSGSKTATLTIVKPALTTYGGAESPAATLSGSINGVARPKISYRQGEEVLSAAPTLPGDYTASITLGAATAAVAYTIAPKPVTIVSLGAADKVYDGKTEATVTGEPRLEGAVGLDYVTVISGRAYFEDADAGENKRVSFRGYGLYGNDADRYVLVDQPADATASITPKPVSITGLTAEDKVYDGNDVATAAGGTIDGMIAGDDLRISVGTARFDDKNVGADKPVTFDGFSLSGGSAGNYALTGQPAATTASVTAKPLTIEGLSAADRVYDGTCDVRIEGTAALNGVVSGDDVTLVSGSAAFADKNVGTKKAVVFTGYGLSGADAGNYSLQQPTAAASVTPKTVTLEGVGVSDKTYDGTTDATIAGEARPVGTVPGDDVAVTEGTAAFDDPNAGEGKTVTFSGFGLTGGDAGNYSLVLPEPVAASIAPRTVALAWSDTAFTYDGRAHLPTAVAEGLVAEDVCEVTVQGEATDAGEYVAVAESLSNGNYALPEEKTVPFTIGKKALSIVAQDAAKTYGEDDPELTYTVEGLLDGDALTGALSRAAGEDVGSYDIGQGTLKATDNYDLTFKSAKLTIGKKALTVTAKAQTKTYGDADPELTYTVEGLVKGEALIGKLSRAAGEDVGSYAIGQGTLKATDNYDLTFKSAKLTIGKKALTVTADAKTKVEGTADSAVTYATTGLVNGDALTGALARNPGEAPGTYDITQGTLRAGDNYSLTFKGAALTITARPPKPVKADYTVLAKMKPSGNNALTLSWSKVADADGYDVFFATCSKGSSYEMIDSVDAPARTYKFSGLKKAVSYRAYVRAWKNENGTKTYIGKASPAVHAITGGSSKARCNAKAVTVAKPEITLAKGRSSAIKATVTGVKAGKKVLRHAKLLRYFSSNTDVAKVSGSGKITAVGSGTCRIYVMANNGVRASVEVTVVTEPTGAAFKKAGYSVKKGRKLSLEKQAKLFPSGVTSKLTWTSSDPTIATVSGKGVVKGVKKGAVTITVKAANGKTATTTVTVK